MNLTSKNTTLRRVAITSTLALLIYVVIAYLGVQQEMRDFQDGFPVPLWIFSLPGAFLLSAYFRNAGFYLPFIVNGVLWFVVGAIIGLCTKRIRWSILFLGIFTIILGTCLFTSTFLTIRSMGDPPAPTKSAAELTQTVVIANMRATEFTQSIIKPFGDSIPATYVGDIVVSPDGKLVALVTSHNTVELWRVAERKHVASWEGDTDDNTISTLAFSPKDNILALNTCSQRNQDRHNWCEQYEILFWSTETHELVQPSIIGHKGAYIAYSPDGNVIATTNKNAISLWNVASRELKNSISTSETMPPGYIAFSPDGEIIAAAIGEKVFLWDTHSYQLHSAFRPKVRDPHIIKKIVFSSDSQKLYALIHHSENIGGLDISSGKDISFACTGSNGFDLELSAGDEWLAVSGYQNTVLLFDFTTSEFIEVPVTPTIGAQYGIAAMAFTPKGQALIVSNQNGPIIFLDISNYPK